MFSRTPDGCDSVYCIRLRSRRFSVKALMQLEDNLVAEGASKSICSIVVLDTSCSFNCMPTKETHIYLKTSLSPSKFMQY